MLQQLVGSAAGSRGPACDGASKAPTPSWPCESPGSTANGNASGTPSPWPHEIYLLKRDTPKRWVRGSVVAITRRFPKPAADAAGMAATGGA